MRRRDRWLDKAGDVFWGMGIMVQATLITVFAFLVLALIIMGFKALF